MVSRDDWKYEPIAVPQGDAQFLAGIKATANQIAAVYRVAPEDVGGSTDGQSLTYKNLEQDQIRFAVRTLRPWTERFESVLNRHLPANQYVKFNLDASARADLLTRFDAHSKGIAAGFETIDEVRALEERAPLTDVQRQQFLEMKPTIGTTP
jgi:HK97 family phage portal protein